MTFFYLNVFTVFSMNCSYIKWYLRKKNKATELNKYFFLRILTLISEFCEKSQNTDFNLRIMTFVSQNWEKVRIWREFCLSKQSWCICTSSDTKQNSDCFIFFLVTCHVLDDKEYIATNWCWTILIPKLQDWYYS